MKKKTTKEVGTKNPKLQEWEVALAKGGLAAQARDQAAQCRAIGDEQGAARRENIAGKWEAEAREKDPLGQTHIGKVLRGSTCK